ncbi:anti-sigma factor family protein [Heyndrickxia acidicola]|uniref:Anti-sigma-W factor RsiW n=1 Tax=Heyndrickxia acidicola TaxID=209389 RepID=A0ABU6MJN3_9BACI|nr:zf-HC2 domain-containing protein [Heyndrickxia acidicola]MED1203863.1 zf-HC2 domain-containing protein [Heyndrickxia acidicola]
MGKHVKDYLSEYVDGELQEETRQLVESHMEGCAECAQELRELTQLKTLFFQAYENVNIPGLEFEQSVLSKINGNAGMGFAAHRINWLFILLGGIFFLSLSAILGPVIYLVVKFATAIFKVSMSLLHALAGLVSAIPFLLEAFLFTTIIILGISFFSVRYLLKTKTIG